MSEALRNKSDQAMNSLPRSFEEHNSKMLHTVADGLGSIRGRVVFLGGTILPLLLNRPKAKITRRAKDVDVIFHANSRRETYDFEDQLWDRGFKKTLHGVVCCWKIKGVRVDVLPSNKNIVRFKNRWCMEACERPGNHYYEDDKAIKVISAPVFLGTKFEAFSRRGRKNHSTSFDIGDIFLVLAGRKEIKRDIDKYASDELKQFLAEEFIALKKEIKNTDDLIPESLRPYSDQVNDCIASVIAYKKSSPAKAKPNPKATKKTTAKKKSVSSAVKGSKAKSSKAKTVKSPTRKKVVKKVTPKKD